VSDERDIPSGPDDDTVAEPRSTVGVQRVVSTEQQPLPDEVIPPHPAGLGAEPVEPRVVTESERVFVAEDGTVNRQAERVEHNPVRRRSGLVPALLIILALALLAIAAAWYFTRTDTASVPAVVGLPLDDAVTRLENDGFKADIVSQPNEATQGTVFQQDPSAGTEHEKGSQVQVLVSKGPTDVTVPNTVGISEPEARDRLAAAGLQVNVFRVFSETVAKGDVVAQSPDAGTKAAKGSAVRINVSKGSGLVNVPNVVGTTLADATAQLSAVGLRADVAHVPAQDPAGTVVAQHPVAGKVRQGSAVRVNVSNGP
jgi:serine/threonine-protein kinase